MSVHAGYVFQSSFSKGSKSRPFLDLAWQKKTFSPFIITQGRKAEVTKEVCELIYLKLGHTLLVQVYGGECVCDKWSSSVELL